MTFGYYRATILAALFNSVLLVVLTLFVMSQGFLRLLNPVHVNSGVLVLVAVISILVNGIVAFKLSKTKQDLNLKAMR